jgi:hypothetical protein
MDAEIRRELGAEGARGGDRDTKYGRCFHDLSNISLEWNSTSY